jgi:hypothetical protein
MKKEDIISFFELHRLPYSGKPEMFRHDPEGALTSLGLDQYFAERTIMMEPIPADAHWQLGIVERSIQSIKHSMACLAAEHPDMTAQEILSTSLNTINSREMIRGSSPT